MNPVFSIYTKYFIVPNKKLHNFLVNLDSVLTTYCFFDNKPEALPVHIEKTAQLELF